ncbi:DUF2313 domain-containing protein [Gluconacetobacter sp. 1b LMG 1731]|uniref:DUF2313 domain-containing protein n=1 Tax=Gluconacetobacter dulcium TaxID=2729096 RepID=A0A7W4IJY3_9PROT|nr:putative phage tail protein [Gluconacetobacter dulcium]MBB2164042.1 DUF2313 domain-containing protein [Gluconacetobacter dulcium]MBB2192746.1 DUF2313 domain-containing protein [Gluconacetobacter dulcium]
MTDLTPRTTAKQYSTALRQLLPNGPAWPKDHPSVMGSVIDGLSQELQRTDDSACDLLVDVFPATTTNFIDEWQDTVGQSTCAASSLTLEQQRAQIVSRLTWTGRMSKQFYIDYAAMLGYQIKITEWSGFTCGLSQVGGTLGVASSSDIDFVITIQNLTTDQSLSVLQCELTPLIPAHISVYWYEGSPGPLISATATLDQTNLSNLTYPLPESVTADCQVTLSGSLENLSSLTYSTADITAVSGFDYLSTSGSATLDSSGKSFTLPITIMPNYGTADANISFRIPIKLTYEDGSISDTSATCAVSYPPVAPVQNTLKVPFSVPFTDTIPRLITWETQDGTAVQDVDYESTEHGTLIPPGWKTVYANVPLLTQTIGEEAQFNVVFKWYDQTVPQIGYGIGQCGGMPIYPVAHSTVTANILTTQAVDVSSIPEGTYYRTEDGTAKAGIDYVASSGAVTSDTVDIRIRTLAPGQSRRYFYLAYDSEDGIPQRKLVVINPGSPIKAISSPTTVNVTTVDPGVCVPKVIFNGGNTVDTPFTMPMSVYSAVRASIVADNLGSDMNHTMMLTVSAPDCLIRNFGNYFPTLYTQIDDHTATITGSAREISGAALMMQFKPLSSSQSEINITLDGNNLNSTATYYIVGGASVMTFQNLPTSETEITVTDLSHGFTETLGGPLYVLNSDAYIEMTYTLEPDVGGGDLIGLNSSTVSSTPSGYGYIVNASSGVMDVVMIPLTIYVGEGTVNTVTNGVHYITLTCTDGTNTITQKIPYTIDYMQH